jgi:serine/threonine protein phosphatase 1
MSNPPVYAIGDIHGHLDKLVELHEWIARDQAKHGEGPIVHVGDYTDRGPNSKGVLDYLIAGEAAQKNWQFLKGNHDRMMAWYLQETPVRDPRLKAEFEWIHPRLGGLETLQSYGIDTKLLGDELHRASRAAVPHAHINFLNGLRTSAEFDGVLFVHAGIRPGVPLKQQTEDDLIWIRDEFHFSRADHGRLIIHGHTPVEDVFHYGNRVNIDTGVAYGGPLSAVVWQDGQVWRITKRGRVKLLPPTR